MLDIGVYALSIVCSFMDASGMMLQYTEDVMDIMTSLRAEWGLTYPEE